MIYIDEIKDLKIYNKPFLLPTDAENKRKGKAVMLLTPNIESSTGLMNHKLMINRYYKSYYIEKDVSFYINKDNVLENYCQPEYVHRHEYGEDGFVLNEGVYNHFERGLVFNGYSDDVNEAMKYITIERIEHYNSIFKTNIKYPIDVTVYRGVSKLTKTNENSISIINYKAFQDYSDYKLYCEESIIEMLINNINPKCYQEIIDAVSSVYSGSYDVYKNEITDPIYSSICKSVKEISLQPNGGSKIVKIIRDNDIAKLFGKTAKMSAKEIKKLFTEEALPPISKLRRNITYSSRKGSTHKINDIIDSIEKASDTTASLDVNIPNPNDDDDIEVETEPAVEECKLFDYLNDEYEITESYIRTKNNITFLNEVGSSIQLKKLLFRQRLRNNKEVLLLYDKIKEDNKDIINTYISYKRYKGLNLFIDLSYYNKLFFENNTYKLDRGVNIYFDLLSKLINDNRVKEAGYDCRTVFIPIKDWDMNPETKMWMYNKQINPISVLYRLMKTDLNKLKTTFPDIDFVFLTDSHYFKLNFTTLEQRDVSKFLYLFKTLRKKIILPEEIEDMKDDDLKEDSNRAIVDTIVDDIEASQSIKISHLTGNTKTIEKDMQVDDKPSVKDNNPTNIKKDPISTNKVTTGTTKTAVSDYKPIMNKLKEIEAKTPSTKNDDSKVARADADKKEIIDKIEKAANISNNVDDTLEILDKDEDFKKMLIDLSSEEDEGTIVNNARASRIAKLNTELLDKEVQGLKVKDILEKKKKFNEVELEKTSIPVDSINPEWKELSYVNMANQYDPNADIVAALTCLSKKSYPISIRNIDVQNTSNSEDYIYTYKVEMESHVGKRFTLRFDIPIIKNNQYMMLRGNRKTISSQSFLMPILKTEEDTVQIVSNYNKILISRFGITSGKSNAACDKIIKTLNKGPFKDILVTTGDNSRICSKYELPIDYIDLASVYSKIETKAYIFYFNQTELREEYKDKIDYKKGLPIAVVKGNTKEPILYYGEEKAITDNASTLAHFILYMLLAQSDEFKETYDKINFSIRYTYSKASILNTEIPVVILAAYSEGLIKIMNKAGIKYEITEKRPAKSIDKDVIKFNDGFISYKIDYNSSLLMNGLKQCDTEVYSISDINKKSMYLDFLDIFGGRIKADGIDNFYDMMIDPITEDVLVHYKLPTDYIELLLYSNALLADNKYIKHGDMSGRRLRRNEIIAGYTYKCLATAYGSYTRQIKHGRDAVMTMKQSAVIDAILLDPTAGDLSIINALNEKEAYDTVTTKGLSGMNSDRSYSLDKRSFDDSMINVLGMSTGFAGNVGISRQATIDANVDTVRGYVKPSDTKEMNSVNSLCMTEALTPMGTTRDDPFRSAMNFVQTSKHGIRCKHSDPLLVTNGADQALPYLISDIFAYKAKDNGTIKEIADDHMVVEYKDGLYEYIDLTEKVEKNSSSGFFVTLKLDTDLKVGQIVKKGSILAYDRSSFDPTVGPDNNPAYKVGTLAKCALIDNDEGFEDSAVITEALSEAMISSIVVPKEITLPKNTNIYNMLQIGDKIEEGDTLMIMQSPFDEEDANTLLKNLVADDEDISDLGRIKIKSKVTGVIQDIVIYRTVELDELSDSLRKLCKKYESNIKSRKDVMRKYGIDQEEELPADYKLDPIGKLKDAAEGVKIIFYLKYEDKMSIGDKLIYWAAQKGVVKYIIPKGQEPYAKSRPDEKIHTLVSISASNGRMVTSIQNIGVLNRLLIEASRKAKDMAGIKYDINLL